MGTKVQLPVTSGPPIIENPPGPMTLTSKLVVDEGKSALMASKHTLLGTPSDPYYHRTDLLNHLKLATVFITLTHGSLGSYSSSYGPAQENEEVGFGAAFSGRAATTPPFNLVVFYSCETLGADGSPGGNIGFQISSTSIGKAYLGFDQTISLTVGKEIGRDANGEPIWQYGTLKQHAEVLFSALGDGKTVDEAVELANTAWSPGKFVNNNFVPTQIYLQGDSRTTINRVYLYFGEIIEEGESTWYWAPLPGLQ